MTFAGADAVREGLLRGLARFIAPARAGEDLVPAFAEQPGGRDFDLAANAAAAEALAQPMLGGGDGAAALLLAHADGAAPPPRLLAAARLVVEDATPARFRLATPHHRFTGDLTRGEIRQHLHGEDGPPALLHSGNLVEFAWNGASHGIDVEDTIVGAGIERDGAGALLWHESAIAAPDDSARTVARLRYDYAVHPATPEVTLTVTLTPLPDVVLDHARITTACDAMSPGGTVTYGRVVLGEDDAPRALAVPAGGDVAVQDGPVPSYRAHQIRTPSRALRLIVRPEGPASMQGIKSTAPAPGRLHWLLTRYAAPRADASAPLVARERRLLLRGLEAPIAVPRGADAAQPACRARVASALAARAPHADAARRAVLAAAAQRLLAGIPEEEAAPALLAWAFIAAARLARLADGPAPGIAPEPLLARLLATGRDDVFREPGEAPPRMADHAAALLALVHALARGLPAAQALRAGLTVLRLVTLPGARDSIEVPHGPAESTEDLALLLRALRAAQAAQAAGALALPAEESRRLAFLADLARRFLEARLRPDGDAILAEGGPAAQAATLAALVPPEGLLRWATA